MGEHKMKGEANLVETKYKKKIEAINIKLDTL
jgi:hypothetical protein